jgi:membrane fusion protein (multidrug efflux system)
VARVTAVLDEIALGSPLAGSRVQPSDCCSEEEAVTTSVSHPDELNEPTIPRRPAGHSDGPARGGRKKRLLRAAIIVVAPLLLLVALGVIKFSQISQLIHAGAAAKKAGPPPEAVSTRKVERATWERTLRAVGSVVSAKGVAVANDAPGVVSRIRFDSGDTVKQGQVLVELDASVERAQLASIRARRGLAETSLARTRQLTATGVLSQSQLDADAAAAKGLTADEAALVAQIDRKIIRAPFTGKLGLRQVNLGQYLAPGTTLTVLESSDADYVDFTLPQENLPLLHHGMTVRATPAGATEPVSGTISAVNPTIDPATRNVVVRARFPLEKSPLRPGMFLSVAVVVPEERQVLAVPATAIVHASYGDSVFVVTDQRGEDGKLRKVVEQKFVKVGDARGDFVDVVDGLGVGEEVVTSGAFKLRKGMPVTIDNAHAGERPSLAPHPPNR